MTPPAAIAPPARESLRRELASTVIGLVPLAAFAWLVYLDDDGRAAVLERAVALRDRLTAASARAYRGSPEAAYALLRRAELVAEEMADVATVAATPEGDCGCGDT